MTLNYVFSQLSVFLKKILFCKLAALLVNDDLFLKDLTPGSEGVFTCCHHIVSVTLTGLGCKGIRDWFALPLSGHWAIHSMGFVQTAEGMQSDLPLLDISFPYVHKNSCPLHSLS